MKDSDSDLGTPMFPSPTRGSGRVRPNSRRDGSGQGRGSSKRMVPCQQCGFLNDIRKIDTRGGSGEENGNGGYGPVTATTETGTLLNGSTFSETYGVQSVRKGAGCAFCGSKNSSKDVPFKTDVGSTYAGKHLPY